jgi:hypothetical protein
VTEEEAMNPLPLIVSVNGPDPIGADEGERLVTTGCGFAAVGEVTAIVTIFEVAPPIDITTGTAFPEGAPGGIWTFT